jgi:hypothetical protein
MATLAGCGSAAEQTSIDNSRASRVANAGRSTAPPFTTLTQTPTKTSTSSVIIAEGDASLFLSSETARQLAVTFRDDFGMRPEDVKVAVVELDAVAKALDIQLERGGRGVVVFAIGDFELTSVGPPGAEPIKGRTAIALISATGVTMGGGLLLDDFDNILDPDNSATHLSEILAG